MRSIKVLPIALAALALSGCASDSSFIIAGRAPDPKAFEDDASDCSGVGSTVALFFGSTLLGAAQGASLGVIAGNSGETALIGAAGGAMIGLLAGGAQGVVGSVSGENYDRCMVQKGYQRVDPQQAEAEAARPVITRRQPPLDLVPNPEAGEPADP